MLVEVDKNKIILTPVFDADKEILKTYWESELVYGIGNYLMDVGYVIVNKPEDKVTDVIFLEGTDNE